MNTQEKLQHSLYWNGDFREINEPIDLEEGKQAIEAAMFWNGPDSVADYEKEWYGVEEEPQK